MQFFELVRTSISPLDIACCNRALREQFLHLVRFALAGSSPMMIGFIAIMHKQIEKRMYDHVQWMLRRGIQCDTVHFQTYVPDSLRALRALERLVEEGVQLSSVLHSVSLPPRDHVGVFRLFPNCTALSASFYDLALGFGELEAVARTFPLIKLHELSLSFPTNAGHNHAPEELASIHYRVVQMHCESLRKVWLWGAIPAPADQLVDALCQCRHLTEFRSNQNQLRTHHMLQLLGSCQVLATLSVCGIALGDILWFTRGGSPLEYLGVSYESLFDGDDTIVQHMERLIISHPGGIWETVEVAEVFKKCRTDNRILCRLLMLTQD